MSTVTPMHSAPADHDALLAQARAVIDREIEGLQAVKGELGAQFLQLVETIHGLKGRVIFSGIGKSAHIARKIAATMASTGTPAYFVHAAEASHGDLGMIMPGDLIFCLSNSGETAELKDVIAYAKRYGHTLVALVRRAESTLAKDADIPIVLPAVPEASPTGAPTTSTTMMLAYGDALAMALLEKRGFTKTDFGKYHPGGKLGTQFIRVGSLMHTHEELPLTDAAAPMEQVLLVMTAKRFGCAGVVNEAGDMVGIITDGDLRRHMGEQIMQRNAAEVMTKNPVTVGPNTLAAEALAIMNAKSITSLFAVDAGKPVGILHVHDCLRAGVM
ncbi:MAG: KpsF/GutQ family sugar-phosphate isomerase [Azospirillum brasilense]|nr:MAG: KpsF/GutQ family sugar-phosphate isomerase [Azospirillum brasilense]